MQAYSPARSVQAGLPDIVLNEIEEHSENEQKEHDDIIIYADDNTPISGDKDPLRLQDKIHEEAKLQVGFLRMTWYAVVIKQTNRHSKLESQNLALKVNICGEEKKETTSEKLLGVIVNNTATFKHHLYGDEENQGLLKQLSSRVGILRKLKKYLPPAHLKLIMEGIFNSKMVYGFTVWGRV